MRADLGSRKMCENRGGYAHTHIPVRVRNRVKSAFSLKTVHFFAVLTVGAGLLGTDGSFLGRYLALVCLWQHANVWVPLCHVEVK
jgi:hypothetical protein